MKNETKERLASLRKLSEELPKLTPEEEKFYSGIFYDAGDYLQGVVENVPTKEFWAKVGLTAQDVSDMERLAEKLNAPKQPGV